MGRGTRELSELELTWVMTERKRFQFSIWNLMVMMVPLAVTFWLASLAREVGWAVWLVAIGVGIGPAVGALIGGWNGMGIRVVGDRWAVCVCERCLC